MFHLNVQGLFSKIDDISLFLDENKYDVVCFSEHWMTQVETLFNVNLIGYKLIAHFCRSKRLHGGVCIFVRLDLPCVSIDLGSYSLEMTAEFCAIEIQTENILVICLYRSCNESLDTFLARFECLLAMLANKYKKIIVMGDFNVRFDLNSRELSEFHNIVDSFGMTVTISESTRVFNGCATCIDNILTNLNSNTYVTSVVDVAISDHFGQIISVDVSFRTKPKTFTARAFTGAALNEIIHSLSQLGWEKFYVSTDVDFMASFLLDNLSKFIVEFCPLKTYKSEGTKINWFTDDLKIMRNRVGAAKIIYDVSKNPHHKIVYNTLRGEYKEAICATKRAAYDNYINRSTNRSRDVWRLINSERNYQKRDDSNSSVSASEFNAYFVSVANDVISALAVSTDVQDSCLGEIPLASTSFFMSPVTEWDVLETINSLKNSKSVDYYQISCFLIKRIALHLIKPLAYLFNYSIETGRFPAPFKLSRVVPIFKKGNPSCVGDYRPISLVPAIAKIFEALISRQLSLYLDSNNCLCDCQYGFRRKCSSVQAVSKIVSEVVEALERGEHVGVIMCDLTKAFDCVSHQLLLKKLARYGVRGIALEFFNSYLELRQQCVDFGGSRSILQPVNNGVPQGSILGPLLFIIYINDLYHYLRPNKCIFYADDTTFVVSDKYTEVLEEKMANLESKADTWFSNNTLQLNLQKTQRLIVSTNNSVVSGTSAKILGTTIDDRLTWYPHVDSVARKLASSLFVLRRLKNSTSTETLLTVYFSLMHSHLTYSVVHWGNSSSAVRLFRVQKKAMRLIANAGYYDHCQPIFKQFGVMPLPSLYIYYQLIEIHINSDRFCLNSAYHGYPTRSSNLIRPNNFKYKKTRDNSLDVSLYNVLPQHLRDMPVGRFKSALKRILKVNCFYSVQEYMHAAVNDMIF